MIHEIGLVIGRDHILLPTGSQHHIVTELR